VESSYQGIGEQLRIGLSSHQRILKFANNNLEAPLPKKIKRPAYQAKSTSELGGLHALDAG
jgi:hypothetical protein